MPNIGQDCETQKQTQVSEQEERLEREISGLHESINILTARLDRVLRSSEPSVEDKRAEAPVLVLLADTLRGFVRDTKNARFRIDDLADRLEL
jgi:hypothetical protein